MTTKTFSIIYHIRSEQGADVEHELHIDEATNISQRPDLARIPDCAMLENHQCDHCPLNSEQHRYCPVMHRLSPLIENIHAQLNSFDHVELEVVTPGRRIFVETTAQRALGSLFGLIIASSPCIHYAFFRPLVPYHLPVASIEETNFRTLSLYLINQYFLQEEGVVDGISFDDLDEIYANISSANAHLSRRVGEVLEKDGMLNALVLLDMFSQGFLMSLRLSKQQLKQRFNANYPIIREGLCE